MKIAIDFDDVIMDYKTSEVMPGAVDAIWGYRHADHEITIFTGRRDAKWNEIKEFMHLHNIPYDRIICGKPIFDIFIDDKARRFEGWGKDYLNG